MEQVKLQLVEVTGGASEAFDGQTGRSSDPPAPGVSNHVNRNCCRDGSSSAERKLRRGRGAVSDLQSNLQPEQTRLLGDELCCNSSSFSVKLTVKVCPSPLQETGSSNI